MKIRFMLALICASFLSACLEQKPEMTPLEIQGLQTKQFVSSVNTTFASTVSVFQDLGYSITSADKDTGLISAESASDSDPWAKILGGTTVVSQTRATAFIEKIGKKSQVRLNFVRKVNSSSRYGQGNRQDTAILEAAIYQNAFERIENAIFLRSN